MQYEFFCDNTIFELLNFLKIVATQIIGLRYIPFEGVFRCKVEFLRSKDGIDNFWKLSKVV